MRGDKHSYGYEVVFLPTKEQMVAYEAAIEAAGLWPVTRGSRRFDTEGYVIAVRYKRDLDAAIRAVDGYVDRTFQPGTRVRTVVPLLGRRERPVGAQGVISSTQGWAMPMVTFDGETVEYHVGSWWYVPVS